jgi:hypothetical protein
LVCTANVPTTVYAEMSGQESRSVLAAVTARPVVGIGGDGAGECRFPQHQLTPGLAAWWQVRLNDHERSRLR